MDEAERCHRLAILERGRLVAEGPPRRLEADLDAVVVEIQTEQPARARASLAGLPWLHGVTQIGERLRALLPRELPDPAPRLVEALARAGIPVRAAVVAANLEDVFVTATRGRSG